MKIKNGILSTWFGIIQQFIILILGLIVPRLFIQTFGSEMNGMLSSVSNPCWIFLFKFMPDAFFLYAKKNYKWLNLKEKLNKEALSQSNSVFVQQIMCWKLFRLE